MLGYLATILHDRIVDKDFVHDNSDDILALSRADQKQVLSEVFTAHDIEAIEEKIRQAADMLSARLHSGELEV